MVNINWEVRAKERRLENKALKKRIKELTISRDDWKAKYMNQKSVHDEMDRKLEVVKKNIQRIMEV
jgi:hypothetical protein